jgi:hypothetical protein
MKKLIFAALVVVSTGILSAFTLKNDTAVVTKHDTTSDRVGLGSADAKQVAHKHATTNDRVGLGSAD